MKPILFLILLFYSVVAHAKVITQAEAMQAAGQFLTHNSAKRVRAHSNTALSLAHAAVDKTGTVDYYVFNRDADGGYLIVAADDNIIPVIGYVDKGAFAVDSLPAAMQWWLDNCQQQIEYLRHHPEQVRPQTYIESSVDPLLTSAWDQGAPFNKLCPTYVQNYKSYRCATGCVATAMAQIMNYHKWPEKGVGAHSYNCKINNATRETALSTNFEESTYDWEHMLDIYPSNCSDNVACNAVSKLMSDVGISVDMQYGASSGAFSPDVVTALTTYFGYSKSACLHAREQYTVAQWEALIRDELDNRRPVYYSGMTSAGGHAFVCDGYDNNGYFHFNWGWNGKSDGYFILSMLAPSLQGTGSNEGGYNSMQSIITGIMPDDGTPDVLAGNPTMSGTCNISTTARSVKLGSTASFSVSGLSVTGASQWGSLMLGIVATQPDIYAQEVVDGQTPLYVDATTFKPGGGYSLSGMKYTPPTSLDDGLYYLRLQYLMDFTERGFLLGTTPTNYVVEMEVKNGVAYFAKHYEQYDIQVSELSITNSTVYKDQTCEVTAVISNNGGNDYCDNVYVGLVKNGTVVATSEPYMLSLISGNEFNLTARFKAQATAGAYKLAVLNASKQVVDEIPVTVVDGGGVVSMQIVSNVVPASNEMAANQIKATATVTNTGGAYCGIMSAYVLDAAGNILNMISSNLVTVETGETVDVSFNGRFAGQVGSTYFLALRNPNPAYVNRNQLWDGQVPFVVCPPEDFEICDVNHDHAVDVADINAVLALLMERGDKQFSAYADVNGDGEIDVTDINFICRILMK